MGVVLVRSFVVQLFEKKQDPFVPDWQGLVAPDEKVDRKEEPERGLFCRHCRLWIASPKDRIEVDGRHLYRFSNPHGVIFQIGCFREASGCLPDGPPEDYWSWFPDYAWQIQRCAQCHAHLGWLYTKPDHAFYGLVLTSLIEGA